MALVSVLPRPLDDPLPLEVLADLAGRAAHNLGRTQPRRRTPRGTRWHVRLHVTDHYDLWLIGWGAGAVVDLHDHGGSAGALAVITGELIELPPRPPGGFRRRPLPAGAVQAFAPEHLHRVANEGSTGAMSAHVYSPPLSDMTFYGDDAAPVRSEAVDLPGLVEHRRA